MSVFPGTFIPTGVASTAKMNHFIDDLLTPRLMAFRQIHIHDEQCELKPDRVTWYVTFGNWLSGENNIIRKGGAMVTPLTVNYVYGTFVMAVAPDIGADGIPRDVMEAAYVFDYFPASVLEGFLTAAVSIINMTAVGPPTSYTADTAPTNWEGVIVDVAYAMAMEKLLLDYDLWRYRLVFAIGPNEVYGGGGGDIASQLTTLKQNAEARADKAMENPKFKVGNYLSPPTAIYYSAVRGGGSSWATGGAFTGGKLNGWKPNKIL